MSIRQFWDEHVVVPKARYRKVMRLCGHSGPVNCFAISCSDLLASGGDDQQVHIWDLNLATKRQTLQDRYGRWGQVTTMLAIDDSIVASPILIFGTGRGNIVMYKRLRKQLNFHETSSIQAFDHIDSVESLSYDHHANRLAVASHSAKLLVFRLQCDGTLSQIWKKQLAEISLPRMLNFVEQGSRLLVHTLEGGKAFCLDVETRAELHTTSLRTPFGNGDMCLATKSIVVENMATGFDLYSLKRTSPTLSYDVPVSRKRVKMVKFGESSMIVVGGSDHGAVYIFNTNSTELLQMLSHPASLIQTVLTFSTANEHIIVSGTSDDGQPGDIYVWKKPTKRALIHNSAASNNSVAGFIAFLILVALVSRLWI